MPYQRRREVIAAHFGEILSGDDAELGRKRLEQHGDQIGEEHHPEQAIAVSGAGLDIGGEIARIDIGDRGDHRRTGKRRIGPPGAPAAAVAGQHRLAGRDGAFRQRGAGRNHHLVRVVRHRPCRSCSNNSKV
jgi:hypothetical protein